MADLKAFAEQLVNLTVKQVNELSQISYLTSHSTSNLYINKLK